jgi:hypothetical protein
MVYPKVKVTHLTQMRTYSPSFRVHRSIVRKDYSTFLQIPFNQFRQVVRFSIQHVVHNRNLCPSAKHTEYPLELIAMARRFVYLSAKLCFINLSQIGKPKIWSDSFLEVMSEYTVDQIDITLDLNFDLFAFVFSETCWT